MARTVTGVVRIATIPLLIWLFRNSSEPPGPAALGLDISDTEKENGNVPPWTRGDFRGVHTMVRVYNRPSEKSSRQRLRRETPKAKHSLFCLQLLQCPFRLCMVGILLQGSAKFRNRFGFSVREPKGASVLIMGFGPMGRQFEGGRKCFNSTLDFSFLE